MTERGLRHKLKHPEKGHPYFAPSFYSKEEYDGLTKAADQRKKTPGKLQREITLAWLRQNKLIKGEAPISFDESK